MHVNVSCPDCSRQLRLPEEVMGQSVRCPMCQTVFTAKDLDAGKAPARAEEDSLPLLMLADDDPPREKIRDRDDRPRRPRRDRETADRRPARRPSPKRGFKLFVHRDPHDKLAGEFAADIDAEGLSFWRGRGREIFVPLGSEAEYLGEGRLLFEVEGRKIEASAVHRDGMNDELAREVVAALGSRDAPFRMPVKPRGKVVWMAFMPLALPLLAWTLGDDVARLGGVLTFSFLGAILAGLSLIFAMQRGMATSARAWTASSLTLGGLFILCIALRVDHSGPPEPPTNFSHWIAFAPIDSGFRADFPGLPESVVNVQTLPINFRLAKTYSVELGGKTHLIAGYGNVEKGAGGLGEFIPGRPALSGAQILSQRPVDADGVRGVEVRFKANDGRSGVARYFIKDDRLFGITFVSRKLSPTSNEAQKFLDSFAFDSSTGWPGPGTPGLKPIMVAAPQTFMPKPAVDPNLPGTDLGGGGTLLLVHSKDFVWAGYRAKTREVVSVTEDGRMTVCDDSGRKSRETTVNLGEKVSGAALSADGMNLAVLGINGKLVIVRPMTLQQTLLKPDTVGPVAQTSAAFSPDGRFLATAHGDQKVRLWDLSNFTVVKRFPIDRNQVLSVAFSADGKEILCGDAGGTLFLLDANDGRIITKLIGHTQMVRSLAMAADGTIISGSDDRSTRFWKLPSPLGKAIFNHKTEVTATAFHPAGRLALSADGNGWVHLFETTTFKERVGLARVRPDSVKYKNTGIRSLAYHATANKILVADGSRLECWDLSRHLPFQAGDLVPVVPRAPSGPSELQDRGKVLIEHQVALICPEKKCALLFSADRKVHRYSYPAWKLTKSSAFPIAVRYAALDAKTGTLYAIEGTGERPLVKRENEILAFDIADLLDDKALPAGLEPEKKIEVGAEPRDLFLDASGKSLYYIEGKFTKSLVRRLDTTKFDAPETLLDKKFYLQLAGTQDRKSLYVLGSDVGQRNPVVVHFEAETGKKEKELAIPQNLGMALHVGTGRLLLSGRAGLALLDWESSRVTVLSPNGNGSGAWIAPQATRIYVEGFIPPVLNAYDVPAGVRTLPPPVFTLEIQKPGRFGRKDGPTFTPDGKFLLYPSGRLIGLGKPAKPASER